MRLLAKVCALALAATAIVGAAGNAGAQSISSLRAQLDRDSSRLERSAEAFDAARIRRQSLDNRLANATQDVRRSSAKLEAARGKLGTAVRDLYMHPAEGLGTFFQAQSYGELQRGSALAGRVALSTDSLILNVRRARAEAQGSQARLQELRDQARHDELEMQRQRNEAASALTRTKAELSAANGALAAELEAERRAGLASAGAIAAERIKFVGPVSPGAMTAVRTAAAQEGKPYVYGAAGPDSFDCSGLTMYAWASAGVSLPHNAAGQYDSLPHVPLSELAPGDLVFFGMPPHHVGIYEGGGRMIHAPHTGTVVQEASIWSEGPSGAARP